MQDGVIQAGVDEVLLRLSLPAEDVAAGLAIGVAAEVVEHVVWIAAAHGAADHNVLHASRLGGVDLRFLPEPIHLVGLAIRKAHVWAAGLGVCAAGGLHLGRSADEQGGASGEGCEQTLVTGAILHAGHIDNDDGSLGRSGVGKQRLPRRLAANNAHRLKGVASGQHLSERMPSRLATRAADCHTHGGLGAEDMGKKNTQSR
mmetsp:Transcript_20216/g.47166  ORF Transcript_20216/g.47166 Transcript_20216/m.47166 type:complete len:202 (-) Transcript_20216:104-709(-)